MQLDAQCHVNKDFDHTAPMHHADRLYEYTYMFIDHPDVYNNMHD